LRSLSLDSAVNGFDSPTTIPLWQKFLMGVQ
jgi:hypothetical protein